MKSQKLNKLITKVGGEGDNAVTQVTYKAKEHRIYGVSLDCEVHNFLDGFPMAA